MSAEWRRLASEKNTKRHLWPHSGCFHDRFRTKFGGVRRRRRARPAARAHGSATRTHARVVHAAGGAESAGVPRAARPGGPEHARRLPRPRARGRDHAPARAPPRGGRRRLLLRHHGAPAAGRPGGADRTGPRPRPRRAGAHAGGRRPADRPPLRRGRGRRGRGARRRGRCARRLRRAGNPHGARRGREPGRAPPRRPGRLPRVGVVDPPHRLRRGPLHPGRLPRRGPGEPRPPGRAHTHARRPGRLGCAHDLVRPADGRLHRRPGARRSQCRPALRLVGRVPLAGGLPGPRRPLLGPGP